MLTSLVVAVFLLKYVVGHVIRKNCSLNSYYYLHKVWLRQLIITSFHQTFDLLPSYETPSLVLLRWLGAYIEDDVKLAEIVPLLRFPSNLLKIERGVTTFARVILAPFEIIDTIDLSFDYISLGSDSNLGNGCTLIPGTKLPFNTMIGNLTRVIRETNSSASNGVWLGIPAQRMPLVMPDKISPMNDLSYRNFTSIHSFARFCLTFLVGHCLLITLYVFMPSVVAFVAHLILYCIIYRNLVVRELVNINTAYTKDILLLTELILSAFMEKFKIFIAPFLSRSQYIVFLFRALGARIGHDVILPDIDCFTEPHLTTIGDHVRLAWDAHIQVSYSLTMLLYC
jgi:hypothetical protein